MAKQIKTRKGKDDYYYPYTSPDLVIDNTGKSATTRFEEIEDNQLNLIEDGTTKGIKDTEYDTLTTTDKTVIGSINELSTQFKDIAKKNISSFCIDKEFTSEGYEINLQEIIDNPDIQELNIDVDIFTTLPLKLKSNFTLYSSNGSNLKFKNCDGIITDNDSILKNTKVYNLNILGNKTPNTTLLQLLGNSENCSFYELNIFNGYNGVFVNGWVYMLHDIRINYCDNIGFNIRKSDNLYYNFYINGCESYGLYMDSSNNKILNFKILSCNKTGSSCYLKGDKNNIVNLEIQDIYNSALTFDNFSNNIISINIDSIRTNITTDSQIILSNFVKSKNNIIDIISTKYGNNITTSSENDLITFDNSSYNNIIKSVLNKVTYSGNPNNKIQNNKFYQYVYDSINCIKSLNITVVGASFLDENNKFIGFTTDDVSYGGYRILINKDSSEDSTKLSIGKYIIFAIIKTDKDTTINITDQGTPAQSIMIDSYIGGYNKLKCFLELSNTSGSSLAIISNIPNNKIEFKELRIYKVDDTFDKNELFYIE